jgi:hypothetical protein
MTITSHAFCSAALVVCTVVATVPAGAQTSDEAFAIAAHLVGAASEEFEETDFGVGGRIAWRLGSLFGLEAEITHFPSDYPERVAFSSSRWEGLFGGTVGPRLGRVRVFGKARAGFLNYREAPRPFACILIFPPPLACTLASGTSVPALDLGGGAEIDIARRLLIRVDASDLALRYQGPAFDRQRVRHDAHFWSHALRLSSGFGLRF